MITAYLPHKFLRYTTSGEGGDSEKKSDAQNRRAKDVFQDMHALSQCLHFA